MATTGLTTVASLLQNGIQAVQTLANNVLNLFSANADGSASAYVAAAGVIKASPGRVMRIVVVIPGSAGKFELNDTTTTTGASALNEIFTMAQSNGAWLEGAIFLLAWPCTSGIVVSAVPTGGRVSISYF